MSVTMHFVIYDPLAEMIWCCFIEFGTPMCHVYTLNAFLQDEGGCGLKLTTI